DARAACELLRIDAVLDERHTIAGDPSEQRLVADAAGEDAAVLAERRPRDRVEVSLLPPARERRVEEPAMSRKDERAPVQRLRDGEEVAEEVEAMHMDQIEATHVLEHGAGQRIAPGSPERDAPNGNAGNGVDGRQQTGMIIEKPVQGQHFGLDAVASLGLRKPGNDTLEASDRWMKLPNHVQNAHTDLAW